MTYRPAGAAESAGELFIDWFNDLELSENAILIRFAVVIGIGGALGVVAFYKSIDLAYALFYRWPPGLRQHGGSCAASAAAMTD